MYFYGKRSDTKNEPHEILHCMGLLVARMLCPHRRRLSDHWATTAVEAIPKGTFGQFVSNERFDRIMQNQHFTDNTDARSDTDRVWKVRSVVGKLQNPFAHGYNVPPVLSFNEAMIPSRSRHNITRQFMTGCAEKAYCLRCFAHIVLCGPHSGPAAVMRNLDKVLPPLEKGVFHAVVTDMFYTSVQLALQLLARNIYSIGTIQTNKKSFPPVLIANDSARPAGIAHGSSTVTVLKCCSKKKAMLWWDCLPVYLLSTGSSSLVDTCVRHVPGGLKVTIPCPSAMKFYHEWMDGVDIHAQLRLQRYWLQLAVCFRKYYKPSFMAGGHEAQVLHGKSPADHAGFLTVLHSQLLQTSKADFIEAVYTAWLLTNAQYILHIDIVSPITTMPTPESNAIPPEHRLTEFQDWVQIREGFRKRPQHQCKVCSIRKTRIGERSATRFYCEACSDGNKRLYLCDRPKLHGHVPLKLAPDVEEWCRTRRLLLVEGIQKHGLGKKRRRRHKQGESKARDEGDAEADASEVGDPTAVDADGDNDEVRADSGMGVFEL
ncbi:hypothetical protein PHMEG_00023974 [Phytophthora megakarya]|uniref:PiggyBac transposable element-derived protein domain-containing protein n=1 Tax=Phytophthora megakarya TaxID=4795 RepID=A0A225VH27_9STRA|nr:hypothetical protein PHMEG_00023974 [Phytophthora megakarya]